MSWRYVAPEVMSRQHQPRQHSPLNPTANLFVSNESQQQQQQRRHRPLVSRSVFSLPAIEEHEGHTSYGNEHTATSHISSSARPHRSPRQHSSAKPIPTPTCLFPRCSNFPPDHPAHELDFYYPLTAREHSTPEEAIDHLARLEYFKRTTLLTQQRNVIALIKLHEEDTERQVEGVWEEKGRELEEWRDKIAVTWEAVGYEIEEVMGSLCTY